MKFFKYKKSILNIASRSFVLFVKDFKIRAVFIYRFGRESRTICGPFGLIIQGLLYRQFSIMAHGSLLAAKNKRAVQRKSAKALINYCK